MSINKILQNIIRTTVNLPQKVIRYISSAAIRTFRPSDDNYPATGVQPFDGDPADKKLL